MSTESIARNRGKSEKPNRSCKIYYRALRFNITATESWEIHNLSNFLSFFFPWFGTLVWAVFRPLALPLSFYPSLALSLSHSLFLSPSIFHSLARTSFPFNVCSSCSEFKANTGRFFPSTLNICACLRLLWLPTILICIPLIECEEEAVLVFILPDFICDTRYTLYSGNGCWLTDYHNGSSLASGIRGPMQIVWKLLICFYGF